MSELPFELVIKILARVPVKGVLRFRCVCKSWRSLFQDMSFIREHTTQAPTTIFLSIALSFPPSICTYEGQKLDMVFKELELNNGEDEIKFLITSVYGPCHGLFCLELVDKSFAVWNPILRELRKVSRIKLRQTRSLIGFGYDYSIQDHKIVMLPQDCTKAQVSTLKSSAPPRMIDFPLKKDWDCCQKEGVLVGENIFWQLHVYENGIRISQDILTFNVVSETFNYCSSPARKRGPQVYLYVLRGSLCAAEEEFSPDYNKIVVWHAQHEKQDKGRIKSWSKILRLKASDIKRALCWKIVEFRIGTVLNQAGSLLVKVLTREAETTKLCETKVCEYNLEEGTIKKVEASLPIGYHHQMKEYIATLVPA